MGGNTWFAGGGPFAFWSWRAAPGPTGVLMMLVAGGAPVLHSHMTHMHLLRTALFGGFGGGF